MPTMVVNSIYSRLVEQCKQVANVDIETLDCSQFAKGFANIPVVYLYSTRDEYVEASDSMTIYDSLSTTFKYFINSQAKHNEARRDEKIEKVFDFLMDLRKRKVKHRQRELKKKRSTKRIRTNKLDKSAQSRESFKKAKKELLNSSIEKRLVQPAINFKRNTMHIYLKNSKRNLKIKKIERLLPKKMKKRGQAKKRKSEEHVKKMQKTDSRWKRNKLNKKKENKEREKKMQESVTYELSSTYKNFFNDSFEPHEKMMLNTKELTEKFQDLESELRNVEIPKTKQVTFLNKLGKGKGNKTEEDRGQKLKESKIYKFLQKNRVKVENNNLSQKASSKNNRSKSPNQPRKKPKTDISPEFLQIPKFNKSQLGQRSVNRTKNDYFSVGRNVVEKVGHSEQNIKSPNSPAKRIKSIKVNANVLYDSKTWSSARKRTKDNLGAFGTFDVTDDENFFLQPEMKKKSENIVVDGFFGRQNSGQTSQNSETRNKFSNERRNESIKQNKSQRFKNETYKIILPTKKNPSSKNEKEGVDSVKQIHNFKNLVFGKNSVNFFSNDSKANLTQKFKNPKSRRIYKTSTYDSVFPEKKYNSGAQNQSSKSERNQESFRNIYQKSKEITQTERNNLTPNHVFIYKQNETPIGQKYYQRNVSVNSQNKNSRVPMGGNKLLGKRVEKPRSYFEKPVFGQMTNLVEKVEMGKKSELVLIV